jgi:hypothetical protein
VALPMESRAVLVPMGSLKDHLCSSLAERLDGVDWVGRLVDVVGATDGDKVEVAGDEVEAREGGEVEVKGGEVGVREGDEVEVEGDEVGDDVEIGRGPVENDQTSPFPTNIKYSPKHSTAFGGSGKGKGQG